MNVVAIVPAAGSGVRMQSASKKPYIVLEGQTILAHTLQALSRSENVTSIIIAVSPGDGQHCRDQVLADVHVRPEITLVAGGERRQDSVFNALAAVPPMCDVILIHDAARPFVDPEIIDAAATAALETGAATAAVPVKDTIMQVDAGTHDQLQILERDTLYAIQTPQAFQPAVIMEAHDNARQKAVQATDDASLVRSMGQPVAIVNGSYYNIKITTAVDLVYGAALLRARGTVQ